MRANSFPSISIFVHLYYPGTYKYLIEKLSIFSDLNVQIFVNICIDTPDKNKIIEAFQKKFPSTHFISTANIGKDIGGKLALYALMEHLKITSEWILFLHDKMSPQSVNGERWRDELYRIFEKDQINNLAVLMKGNKTGIICSKEFLVSYSKTDKKVQQDPNYEFLFKQSKRYNIQAKNFKYVGGTIFWIRKSILDKFFSEEDVLSIRNELEEGNVMDNHSASLTHTWERLFGLICAKQGYKLEGI